MIKLGISTYLPIVGLIHTYVIIHICFYLEVSLKFQGANLGNFEVTFSMAGTSTQTTDRLYF